MSLKTVLPVNRIEELPYCTVPIHHLEYAGQMIPLHKLLQCSFEHPELSVVVNYDLLSESVVPEAQHYIDQGLPDYFFRHDDSSGHT